MSKEVILFRINFHCLLQATAAALLSQVNNCYLICVAKIVFTAHFVHIVSVENIMFHIFIFSFFICYASIFKCLANHSVYNCLLFFIKCVKNVCYCLFTFWCFLSFFWHSILLLRFFFLFFLRCF